MGVKRLARCGISLWSAVALATIVPAGSAMAQKQERAQVQPTAIRIEGTPTIPLGNYDLARLGYTVEEYFVSGSAQSYRFLRPSPAPTAPGRRFATLRRHM